MNNNLNVNFSRQGSPVLQQDRRLFYTSPLSSFSSLGRVVDIKASSLVNTTGNEVVLLNEVSWPSDKWASRNHLPKTEKLPFSHLEAPKRHKSV